MGNAQRFVDAKCDRCGKTTAAQQNNTGDLFCITDDEGCTPELLGGLAVCAACCRKYTIAEWLTWCSTNVGDRGAKVSSAIDSETGERQTGADSSGLSRLP